ncbi:MAG: hypothetical protein H7A45_03105 [Verrucomicrobiales bacterium]|nr:hypothetical protein [Verrucomicrobiales bacterium]
MRSVGCRHQWDGAGGRQGLDDSGGLRVDGENSQSGHEMAAATGHVGIAEGRLIPHERGDEQREGWGPKFPPKSGRLLLAGNHHVAGRPGREENRDGRFDADPKHVRAL